MKFKFIGEIDMTKEERAKKWFKNIQNAEDISIEKRIGAGSASPVVSITTRSISISLFS